ATSIALHRTEQCSVDEHFRRILSLPGSRERRADPHRRDRAVDPGRRSREDRAGEASDVRPSGALGQASGGGGAGPPEVSVEGHAAPLTTPVTGRSPPSPFPTNHSR